MFLKKPMMLILLMSLLLVSSCSTQTQLYERWHDDQYFGPKLQKVLVLGVFKDDTQRRRFESNFVQAVDKKGKRAVAGYTIMPNADDYDTKEDIVRAVKKIGADAVLITSFKGVVEKENKVPPRVDYVPRMGVGNGRYGYGFGGYYGSRYETVYRPGYTKVDKIVQLETQVFSVKSEKLVWSGKTKSINASSADKITKELVTLVINDMKQSGLIGK